MLDIPWDGREVLNLAVRLQALSSDLTHLAMHAEQQDGVIASQGEEIVRLRLDLREIKTMTRSLEKHLSASAPPAPWWMDLHSLAPLLMTGATILILLLKWTGHGSAASDLATQMKSIGQ